MLLFSTTSLSSADKKPQHFCIITIFENSTQMCWRLSEKREAYECLGQGVRKGNIYRLFDHGKYIRVENEPAVFNLILQNVSL